MIYIVSNTFSLLKIKERFLMFVILLLMIFYSILEIISVGILVPLVSILFGDISSYSLVQNKFLSQFFYYFLAFDIKNLLFLVVIFFFLKIS